MTTVLTFRSALSYVRSVARKEKKRKRPVVISRHGRYRFQTGMVTASLLDRGLGMEDAREIARAVREDIGSRAEIPADRLASRINALIEERLGADAARQFQQQPEQAEEALPLVDTEHGRFPFSKGVVLRHLDTSGLELDAAIELVRDLGHWVSRQKAPVIPETELHSKVARMLKEHHGDDYARRYRLTDWVRRSEAPVVILIGGATGTGKSTLAMELAYRLGVVWLTSTDMVRETMRTVLSPDLVPGLHDHSFRGIVLGGQVLSDPRERVLAGFRQQAAQVAVGVRAVIQRAIRENAHILIEGTHLYPPFDQYLPAGTSAQVAGFILAVPSEAEHRQRFPTRSQRQNQRPAEPYLDAFQSVRWIHEDLLRMAEESEAVVVPNLKRSRTLRGAIDFLSRALPVDRSELDRVPRRASEPQGESVPTLFLVLDGLGDEPNPALNGKTPLGAAETPFLRRLASAGGQGRVITLPQGRTLPSTDLGLLALLGGKEATSLDRGAFEALGQGVPIPARAILFRGNLATADLDGAISDRRAGRIRAGVPDLLAGLREVRLRGGLIGRIYPGHEHRVLVMLVGHGLSAAVSDTDPGDRAAVQRIASPRALDDTPEAGRTADALQELLTIAADTLARHPLNAERLHRGLPPVNAVITRGASLAPPRRRADRWLGAMVSGCNTAMGVARFVGLKTASSASMTGSTDTNLDAKFETARDLLEELDLVVVHIKGTDVAAHDRRPFEKRDFISAIDAALGRFLTSRAEYSGALRVVVAADHGTSSISGHHLCDPVPLLLATWRGDVDEQEEFDEETSARGALGTLQCDEFVELIGLGRSRSSGSLPPLG